MTMPFFPTATRIFVGSFLFLLTTGTIVADDKTAVRKQNIDSNVTYPTRPQSCRDDPRKYEACSKADKPCHCEENRYEMYTYCKRSCGFCTRERQPQRFWRVVNWAPLNRTWYINEVQFFLGKNDKVPLATNDPTKAVGSSTYLSFPASNAFDGNRDTAWLPDGWWERQAGGDWIGYDFAQPVDINSVRIVSDLNDSSDVAGSMLIEAGPTPFGPFETKWMIMNRARIADKRFHNPRCPIFWKRFMTDNDAFCYKLVTEYLSWSDARDKCATYGGDLVSINSHEEQIFVQQEVLACGFTWLGFNDIQKEQTFKWSDGSNSSFFYWASDEEKDDRMNEMEDCAAMGRDGQWRQFNCENRFYAFCKKRILTDDDKVVAPNTVSAPPPQSANQTQPPILPPDVSLPPGITAPSPPRYSGPQPAPAPGTPAPGTPAPGTPAPGTPAPGTPALVKPQPGTPPAPGNPPPATGNPAPGAPPPAPAAVTAPAPAPANQTVQVADLDSGVHHIEINVYKHKTKTHPRIKSHNGKKKKAKEHHKKDKKKKQLKSFIKKKEESLKFEENKQSIDNNVKEDMMDDFLDMVARSDIPKPRLSEKQLRSNIRKQKMKNAERQLREEKEKTKYSLNTNTER